MNGAGPPDGAHPPHTPDAVGHDHVHGQGVVIRGAEAGRLKWVLALTATFMVAEVAGGIVAGSLALLADAGHMLTDAGALGLSLFAMRMAERPANTEKTYGYVRLEILAALLNGAALVVITGLIVHEAWTRLHAPTPVRGGVMLVVAVLGLVVNAAGTVLLHGHARGNLNLRGAYLHVLSDLLGSLGAVGAGSVILLTGWTLADPIVSLVIAVLILHSAWKLVREATEVLLEAAPANVDVAEVVEELSSIRGLSQVHDVHVWTLTSGFIALSGHGVIDSPTDHTRVLAEIQDRMAARGIGHVTFQLELRPLYQLPSRDPAP
ncbi:MAG: cation diffusion facilitator family transporter [Gemmatimonadetes bacterium]|nr:cation diffusion facilitator family transporter [Gemmatimonadota bacterium]